MTHITNFSELDSPSARGRLFQGTGNVLSASMQTPQPLVVIDDNYKT
jgi:hypothetical protein